MVCFKISFVVKLFVVCFCYSSFDMVLVLISGVFQVICSDRPPSWRWGLPEALI